MRLPPNPQFVGRADELRTLAQLLPGGSTAAIGPIAAATGLGGIGKTQLATEFAHRYGQFFAGGVYWLSMAEADAVPTEVAACGLSGGLDLPAIFPTQSLDSQVALILARWQLPIPRLLIFDNCEDEALLNEWRPSSGGCRVLLTSRRARWDEVADVQLLPLPVLQRAESLALLRTFRPNLDVGDPDLDAVAAELGDLPLALHLAGSYLKQYRDETTVGAYLAELRGAQLLAHESLQGIDRTVSPTNHPLHVGRTFTLSLERLAPADATDALALELLARAACFAPGEPIPRELLLKTVELPDTAAQRRASRAITRLLNLGVLEAAGERAVRMHRLVVAFVVETVSTEAQAAVEQLLQDTGQALIGEGIPAPLSAIQAHLRHVADVAQERDDSHASDLCAIVGRYLQLIGSYTAARPYLERALAIEEGRDDQDAGRISLRLDSLASLLQDMGDYPAARPLYERALAIDEQLHGPDHSNTSAALNNLALLLQAQGDYPAARPLLERALAIAEASLGPHHPETGTRLNNLASLLKDLGDYPAARPLYERALTIAEASLGPEHPETGIRLNNLASLLQAQGDYPAARPLLERALAIREHTLGADHPDTAQSLWWIATILKGEGDQEGARERLTRAVAIFTRALGAVHPRTQNCQRWLDTLGPPSPGDAS